MAGNPPVDTPYNSEGHPPAPKGPDEDEGNAVEVESWKDVVPDADEDEGPSTDVTSAQGITAGQPAEEDGA